MADWEQKQLSFTYIQNKNFKDALINSLHEKKKIGLLGYLKNTGTNKSMSVRVTISNGELIDYLNLFNLK